MWGSWAGFTLGGLLIFLLLVGIAFGTAPLIFAVLIAAVILGGIAAAQVLRRAGGEPSPGAERRQNPRSGAAPAAGEGSTPPSSA
jgi:hypothetical protein